MEVPPARLNPARAALRNVIQAGAAFRLSTVRVNLLRASGEPPRTLVGSLLRSLTSTLTSSDASLLTEMACDALNEYLPAARLWALRQAGLQRLAAARSCLEAAVVATDLSRRLAAAEALGNLRDTRSLAVLGSVLDGVLNESADGSGRPADGGLAVSLVLALGKLRDPAAVPRLRSVAAGEEDLALHSTVVHALGLIGGTEAVAALTTIGNSHPNTLVRELARHALARLAQGRT
jgi:HEAT repeat protein